jgi:cytochrome b involved in lipid metabolism
MDKGSKNWDPSSMVNDQQQESSMMTTSSPIINDNDTGKRQFTWEEICRHSNKKDRWIVIDTRVYDVTKWLKHPGGQKVLNHYAGQDASVRMRNIKKSILDVFFFQEAFHAFHPEMSHVQKYLK